VKVNEVVGVAGFVVPGMRVDVLITGLPPGGNAFDGPKVRTLLQNIQVLSAGVNFQKDREGKPEQAQVVNLLVTPAQAEILSLASNETHIQLVLRNPWILSLRLPGMICRISLAARTLRRRFHRSARRSHRRPYLRQRRSRPNPPHTVSTRSKCRTAPCIPKPRSAGLEGSRENQTVVRRCENPGGCLLALSFLYAAAGQQTESLPPVAPELPAQSEQDSPAKLLLTVGKSMIIDNALPLERVSSALETSRKVRRLARTSYFSRQDAGGDQPDHLAGGRNPAVLRHHGGGQQLPGGEPCRRHQA